MDYEEALAKVQSAKNDEGFMKVSLGYSHLLVPYKDGVNLMACLIHAEEYESNYGSSPKIVPLSGSMISATRFSRKEYQEIKIAQLMGISLEDLKTSLNPPTPRLQ